MAAAMYGVNAPVVIFFGGGAEVPIDEFEVWRAAQKFPADDATGVDKMDF